MHHCFNHRCPDFRRRLRHHFLHDRPHPLEPSCSDFCLLHRKTKPSGIRRFLVSCKVNPSSRTSYSLIQLLNYYSTFKYVVTTITFISGSDYFRPKNYVLTVFQNRMLYLGDLCIKHDSFGQITKRRKNSVFLLLTALYQFNDHECFSAVRHSFTEI